MISEEELRNSCRKGMEKGLEKLHKKEEERRKTIPTESGFYWARSSEDYDRYDIIVLICGKAPYFKAVAWDYTCLEVSRDVDVYQDIEEFGPKIEEPKPPKQD